MAPAPGGPGAPTPNASGGSVRPGIALVFATILFGALVIGGLGVITLITNEDIIAVPDYGSLAAAAGVFLAGVAFAVSLWSSVRRPSPSYWGALRTAAVCFLVYVVVVGIGGLVPTGDFIVAIAVAGRLITAGFAPLVAGAALVSAWGGIALVRTRAGRPRWPWERDDSP
ncbi:hypothetical protein GCM10022240_28060 [Microbacterium kribbense]|uniref:Uncharacterized protein n=1 Tax=Microbacterium kribbense TaxID=433645 RepID=A0ABP7GU23_9MICO